MEKHCITCNKLFIKKPSHSKKYWETMKYCSRSCKRLTPETKKRLSIMNTLEKHPKWKGGVSKTKTYKNDMLIKRRKQQKENGGSYTLGEWETLKVQYNNTCPSCKRSVPFIGQRTQNLTPDHIIPICKGGSNNIENIQPLCYECNVRKNTKVIKYEI